jgi:hypothetical protein
MISGYYEWTRYPPLSYDNLSVYHIKMRFEQIEGLGVFFN